MLILFETPAGYALFKVLDPSKLEEVGDLYQYFNDPENASKTVKLAAMYKFKDSAEALKSVAKTIKGKMPKTLKKFLQENIISKEISDNLQCEEKKLASTISQKLGIDCQSNEQSLELIRGIRFQMNSLLKGISENDMKAMSLGLAHSLSRYKLKFSAEKVDVMIIHATSLLDDIDKELNNYNMRLKEWYSWHFPELSEIVTDNLVYSKIAQKLGIRTNIHKISLTDIVTEEISNEIAEAVELSMGTEILPQDEVNIKKLAGQIIELTQYRDALGEYLKNRMMAIAPNLSAMVGEIVGSKLIAKAGSLMNLAKLPASTVQILGAEKALFKAMRAKQNTPKYGLIYHASLVGQAPAKIKGKISRSLAAKCSLCIRYDALGESNDGVFGATNRQYIEAKMKKLEQSIVEEVPKISTGPAKYQKPRDTTQYNDQSDFQNKAKKKKPE